MARPKDYDVEQAVETFAQALIEGYGNVAAYRLSHPNYKSTNANAARVKACEFAHRPDVQERLAQLKAELHERHMAFTDTLVDMLQEEITTCYKDNHTLSPVMKQVDVAVRVLGMDKKVIDVNASVDRADPDTVADKLNFLAKAARKDK